MEGTLRATEKMKLASALVLLAVGSTAAFSPLPHVSGRATFVAARTTGLFAVLTGPGGKPATSKEEDMALTFAIIMDHEARSSTVSKEQFIVQMESADEAVEEAVEDADLSIPYDAAAQLAYEESDKSAEYDDFKAQYEADAVAMVTAKQPVDVSIPYDAAARVAWEATDRSADYASFKTQYEADTVAMVTAKQPKKEVEAEEEKPAAVDVSIPYDAAAKLAYDATDKSTPYEEFRTKYEADAVAQVIAKKEA